MSRMYVITFSARRFSRLPWPLVHMELSKETTYKEAQAIATKAADAGGRNVEIRWAKDAP